MIERHAAAPRRLNVLVAVINIKRFGMIEILHFRITRGYYNAGGAGVVTDRKVSAHTCWVRYKRKGQSVLVWVDVWKKEYLIIYEPETHSIC